MVLMIARSEMNLRLLFIVEFDLQVLRFTLFDLRADIVMDVVSFMSSDCNLRL